MVRKLFAKRSHKGLGPDTTYFYDQKPQQERQLKRLTSIIILC